MKVTFAHYGDVIASSRLRAKIPQQELAKLGIQKGKDVLVYGKHLLGEKDIAPYRRRIFDICDDHFNGYFGDYYREHARNADVVTCNSEAMKQRIKECTGRDAIVVIDPYEGLQLKPCIGPRLLWFGHRSNLADLERISPHLKHPILALSNHPDCMEWTPEAQRRALAYECIVVIPTGKSPCKSENRLVEAVRSGKYVCAEHLPAYEKFEPFFPLGDIPTHVEEALAHPERSLERIVAAQEFIDDRFSPQEAGRQWLEVIHGNIDLC